MNKKWLIILIAAVYSGYTLAETDAVDPIANETEIEADSNASEPTDLALVRTPRQIHEELSAFQDKLANLESGANAYDAAIAEVSLDIGDRLLEQHDHENALVSYRRALHVTRINEGLNSDRQVPILERIFATHYAAREIPDATATMDRITNAIADAHGRQSPELKPHLNQKGRWHIAVYQNKYSRASLMHLIEAHNAFDRIRRINKDIDTTYEHEVYHMLSAINFQIAEEIGLTIDRAQGSSPVENIAPGIVNFALTSYRRGKGQLEENLERAMQTGDPELEVQAILQLADWEQLFKKRFTARDHYESAFAKVSQLPTNNLVDTTFTAPKRLPDQSLFDLAPIDSSGGEFIPIKMTVDISSWGQARNVRLVNTEPDTEDTRLRRAERTAIRTAVRSTYRPSFVEGIATATKSTPQTVIVKLAPR